MHKRNKRKPYQKVTTNRQSIEGNNNNQAGRDINFFSHMRANPKNIELSAVKNYDPYYYIGSLMLFAVLMCIGLNIAKIFHIDIMHGYTFLVLFCVSGGIAAPFVIFLLDWAFKKFNWGHIKYKDGVIEYDGKQSRFYEDIWSIELKRGLMNKGKIEYFEIDAQTNRVRSTKIVLMKYHEAKYLHDIFWYNNHTKEFRENIIG